MEDFLYQIETGANATNLYYLALIGALAVPDICGGLESPDGQAKGERYVAWFDSHVAPLHRGMLTGQDCYYFRCSFLHQGRTKHPRGSFSRILFIKPHPSRPVAHMNVMDHALNIDVRMFCLEMVAAARNWLTSVQGTEPYETNLNAFVQRYPDGLPPYIGGVPVIS